MVGSTIIWIVLAMYVVQGIRILPSEAIRRRELTVNSTTIDRLLAIRDNVPVDVPSSPDGHLVTSLPLLNDDEKSEAVFPTKHWAGHLPVSSEGDKYFFYWLFAPDFSSFPNFQEQDSVPIIVWLNGGPACSSMDGLFLENGPFRFRSDPNQAGGYRIEPDKFSWHKATPSYTLYIDQPVGTGLSFTTSGKYPRNDLEVNIDFYYFLQEFFKLHSDKFVSNQKLNRKLFFSGESYAGHYIPSLMNYLLHQKSSKHGNNNIEISVAGAAIGNGWVDPYYQYAGADFAFGEGLLGFPEVADFAEKEKACQQELNRGHYNVGVCFDLIDEIIDQSHGQAATTKVSGYDVRKSESKHGSRDFPPGHKIVETYLGGWKLPAADMGFMDDKLYQQVLHSIHASAATEAGQRYKECTDPPYNALSGNDGKGVVDDVVQILDHPDNVQLLFFNGIHDIVCNHVGNERFLQKLPWKYSPEWTLADRYAWFTQDGETQQVAGYMKDFRNLKFLKVLDAGHMVPMDVPHIAAEMMRLFIYNESFDSSLQELEKSNKEGSCPICPKCMNRDSASYPNTSVDANTSKELAFNTTNIFGWFAAGIVCIILIVGAVSLKRMQTRTLVRSTAIPQYDIELRDSTYRDQPNGVKSYKEDEKSRVVD